MFDYGCITNPECFQINRLDAHSDHTYYAGEEEYDKKKSSFRYSLDGQWKFLYASNLSQVVPGFEQMDYNCKNWKDIMVPSHIQLQGYDVPQYTNVMYPWDGLEHLVPGEVPQDRNSVGSYVKYFNIPEHMKKNRIFISFQGVESAFSVWLNGIFIGYGEDSFTPSEYELTDAIMEGENKLAVQVFQFSSGSWLEDQDFWRFSGIFREVFLYTIPEIHVKDLFVRTYLKDDFMSARLSIRLRLEKEEQASTVIVCNLREMPEQEKNLYVLPEKKLEFVPVTETRNENEILLEYMVENPELWSAEHPYLYELSLQIRNDQNQLQEILIQQVGFRRFELKDGLMCLNGKRIVFRGVNRHDFSCINGRAVSKKELEADIIHMKRNNINAIRTSHYPNNSILYELCDRYGIYLIDETNMETHGTWGQKSGNYYLPGDHQEWLAPVIDRANSMLQRDKNHPSILLWSCGNEAHGGKNIYEMSELFRREDDTRLVHYEGIQRDRRYPKTSDIESQMYADIPRIEKFLKENPEKPFICCEYAHTMGNSGGAHYKYTDFTKREPRYQGGFLWDYADQGIQHKNRYGENYFAYGGDFGDRPADYSFCFNGIVYSDHTDSPKMQEIKFNYQNIALEVTKSKINIINDHLFLNTNIYSGKLRILRNGQVIHEQEFTADVEPLCSKEIRITIPESIEQGEYTLVASMHLKQDMSWARAGHEMAFGQYTYVIAKENVESVQQCIHVVYGSENIGVHGEHFHALFHKLGRGLVSYRYADREYILGDVRPSFVRATTGNDAGNQLAFRTAQWKIGELYAKIIDSEYSNSEQEFRIRYTYEMPTNPKATFSLGYVVDGKGRVHVALDYNKVEGLSDLHNFGISMILPAELSILSWYGNGPEETYIDRMHGAKLACYENRIRDNLSGYEEPQECGNKTGVRYAAVTDEQGQGLNFFCKGVSLSEENAKDISILNDFEPMELCALPFTAHELEAAKHQYELPPIHHTVVRASLRHMGVGGDDSWGARTHEEFLIHNESMHFEFSFGGREVR